MSEIEVLRREHPLRERFVGQEALALYRSGRPADAIRTIDRFRRAIGDELGVHQRIWWIDGGAEAPLVIIAGTPGNDRSYQTKADELLDSLVIGEPQAHPDADDGS